MTDKPTILVVDDEAFNLDIMVDYLSFDNFNTLRAENGAEAIKVLEEHPEIALIILDRMMPNMDGIAFLKIIKADARWNTIPVIMQTAAATSDQVAEGAAAGVYHYLTKPYEYESLMEVVKNALISRDKASA